MSTFKSRTIITHIAAIMTVIVWGSSFLSTKVLMEAGISPAEMYTFRFAGAYILLLMLTFRKLFANNWRDELTLMLCGICAGSLYFITENYALQNTTAGNVSLLASISPIFTAILMALFFKTRIKAGVIIGSIVAFVGVTCIIFNHGTGFQIRPEGDILALSASLSWAVYTIAVKRLIPLYSSLFITRKLFFYGVISSLPLLFAKIPIQDMQQHLVMIFDLSHPEYLANFFFLVIFCSVIGYILWNDVMKSLGPVKSNNYLYGQPIVTMIAGHFFLGEHIYILGYIGCVLVIGGLILSDKLQIPHLPRFRR